MSFEYDEEKQKHYFDNLTTKDGERIYIEPEIYESYQLALETGETEGDARIGAAVLQAERLARQAGEKVKELFGKHQTAQFDRAMEIFDNTHN